jgi:hypothetical protein
VEKKFVMELLSHILSAKLDRGCCDAGERRVPVHDAYAALGS